MTKAAVQSSTLLLTLATALGLGLRLLGIDVWPLWYDEAVSAEYVRHFDWELIIREGTRNPPLYTLILNGWAELFGDSEFSLRALSAVVGAATVPVAYLLAKEIFDRPTARVTAVLLTLSPFHIYYSQEGRPYALLIICVSVFYLFLLRGLSKPQARHWVGVAVAGIVGMYLHYFMALVLLASAWPLLIWERDSLTRRRFVSYLIAMFAIVAAIAPWVVFSFFVRHPVLLPPYWIAPIGIIDAARLSLELLSLGENQGFVWKQYLTLEYPRLWRYAGLLCVVTCLIAAVLPAVISRIRPRTLRPAMLTLGIVIIPCGALLVASALYAPMYLPGRYELLALVPLLILISRGVVVLRAWSARTSFLVLASLLVLYSAELYLYYKQPVLEPNYYPGIGVARVLGERLEESDAVFLHNNGVIARYYAPRFGLDWEGAQCGRIGQRAGPGRLIVPKSRMGPVFDFEIGVRSDQPESVMPYFDDLLAQTQKPVLRVWVDSNCLPILSDSLAEHEFALAETIYPTPENKFSTLMLFQRAAK